MVHEGKNGRMAVVTVLYKIGRADTFIRSVHKMKNLLPIIYQLFLIITYSTSSNCSIFIFFWVCASWRRN